MTRVHFEEHSIHRIGWLRAAVLGANDGLVSTASLIVGIAAATADISAIMLAGTAGLVAGAMSMAAGEYVSVSSQSDTEKANLELEKRELRDQPDYELRELAGFFTARGVKADTALQVAEQMTAHDALAAHAHEEHGIFEFTAARPLQAAVTSALTFATGAALPLVVALLAPDGLLIWSVILSTLLFLALLGALGAKAGSASMLRGMARVTFWGAVAMAVTALVGTVFGIAV